MESQRFRSMRIIARKIKSVLQLLPVILTVSHGTDKGKQYEGITAMMTEHKVRLFLDEGESLKAGTSVSLVIDSGEYKAELTGAVTDVHLSASGSSHCAYSGNPQFQRHRG